MSSIELRKYIDLLEERQQLDEGVLDSLMGKVKQLKDKFFSSPGAQEAFNQANQDRDEIESILKNSKSADQAIKAVQALAQQRVGGQVQLEAFGSDGMRLLGKFAGGLGILWSLAVGLINQYYDAYSMIFNLPDGGEKTSYLIANVGLPLLMFVYGILILKSTKTK